MQEALAASHGGYALKPEAGSLRILAWLAVAIAWRNLWRAKRRTWLMAGGIAFSIFLLSFGSAANYGTFNAMIRSATDLLLGHVQVGHEAFVESEQFRHRLARATELLCEIERVEGVAAATARAQAGALVSVGESSMAGLVMGVDATREPLLSTLPNRIIEGRYLRGPDEALIGSGVARRLNLSVGDEVVVLGSSAEGGVAAMAQRLVGVFETGIAELDRALVQVPLASMQLAFELGDDAHTVIVSTDNVQNAQVLSESLNAQLKAPAVARAWNEVDPQIQQMLDLKIAGLGVFFGICVLMVGFSMLSALLMSVFERTREFGVMTALGMGKQSLFAMLQLEGLMLSLLGVALAALALSALFGLLSDGIPLPPETAALFEEFGFGSRLLIEFDLGTFASGSGVMVAATQTAAFIASLRLRTLSPTDALRAE